MKIVSIVGARPQFIKLAPFLSAFSESTYGISIHTGQHYDENMSQNIFTDLSLKEPDYNLGIKEASHGKQLGRMVEAIEDVLEKERPDLVVVFGDTNSTLAGSLAASKMLLQVAHVEAGLRSFNRAMPEEINRILTDHCSDYLFASTKTAMINLEKEGLINKSYLTGDIMCDAINYYKKIAEEKSSVLTDYILKPKQYILLTLHRPYNVDNSYILDLILSSLKETGKNFVFPAHPRTLSCLENFNINVPSNILLIEPIGYLDFLCLEMNAEKIVTDSGGIQKEAYLQGVPCITLRSETEWIETVEEGWNVIIGNEKNKIIEAVLRFKPSGTRPNIFGDGKSAEKMLKIIES